MALADLLATVTARQGRDISDPATGERIGTAPEHTVADLERALVSARAAQPAWAARGDAERREFLRAALGAIAARAEDLAELVSREQGKPLEGRGARFEVGGCQAWLDATIDLPLEPEVLIRDGDSYAELHYAPLGVVGAIGPWNWPLLITMWQIAPALRMGNTVVLKPSEYTPLSVLALGRVMNEVLPEGVLHVVAGGREVGEALAGHPDVDKVTFTGSVATGKAIVRASADDVKRLTLELGGNDAAIVLPDADPAAIAEDLFWSAFINTGQTCNALKRLYVADEIYDDVCAALVAVASAVPMGPGLDEANLLGPLQNRGQYDIVSDLVEGARAAGARILLGGDPDPEAPGNFYPTTLVADIDPSDALVTQEQFGPALPIVRYSHLDEAIAYANGLDVGLGASVWSADPAVARSIAERLEAGTVWINKHADMNPLVPFGGAKQSGYGLEFGVEGLKAMAQPKVISG